MDGSVLWRLVRSVSDMLRSTCSAGTSISFKAHEKTFQALSTIQRHDSRQVDPSPLVARIRDEILTFWTATTRIQGKPLPIRHDLRCGTGEVVLDKRWRSSAWNNLVGSSGFGSYPLWVANWGVSCPNLPFGWTTFSFWQYTDTGSVPGIIGAADLDLFDGSIADLRSLAGYPRYQPAGTMCDGEPGHQILPPIDSGGSSLFKQGRTVPARFRVCDLSGQSVGTDGVVSSFTLTDIITGTVNTAVDESVSSSTPDSVFRWDETDQQWIFNIDTSGLSGGSTYVFAITVNDGTTITFQFGLK